MSRESSVFSSSVTPFRIVFLMWAAFYVEYFYGFALTNFGIRPREFLGLTGIFIAPLLHGSVDHLVSNTVPLLFLGTVLYFFYDERLGGRVFLRSYFWTNALVWLFGRPGSNHIGASGLVYGLAFFLIFYGLFKRDFLSLFISIVILLLYGGVFYGVLPTDPRVSYESHLAGALVGIFTAIQFGRKKNLNR